MTTLPQAMIAIAFDDGVGFAALERFFRKQRGVNAAVDDPRAAAARHPAHLVAAQSVAGVDADADNVAGLNGLRDDLLERFIDEDGIAGRLWRGGGKNKQPARRDDRRSKRIVAWVDQMNAHGIQSLLANLVAQRASR